MPSASVPPPVPPSGARARRVRHDTLQLWTRDAAAGEQAAAHVARDGAAHATLTQLSTGAFLPGYALALGAGTTAIGLLAGLPLLARLTQLVTSWHVERAGHWRRSALQAGVAARLPVALAAVLPFLPLPLEAKLAGLVALVTLAALGASVYDVAFLSWLAELVPPRIRGRFLARRQRLMGLVGLGASLAAAFLLDRWRRAAPSPLPGFAAVFLVAGVVGLTGLLALARIPEPRRDTSRAQGPGLREALTEPWRDPNYRRFLRFLLVWGTGMGISAPFLAVYMLTRLGLSFVAVTALNALAIVVSSLTLPWWGRLADHFGTRPIVRSGAYFFVGAAICWTLTEPGRLWPLVLGFVLSGLAAAAYDTPVNSLVLAIAPPTRRASYLASFGATYGLSQAVAPILGGLLLEAAGGQGEVAAFTALFGTAALLRAASTPLLGHVHEPDAATVGRVIRTVGRARAARVRGVRYGLPTREAGRLGLGPIAMGAPIVRPLDPVFRYGYYHLARVADFVTREGAPRPPPAAPEPPGDA